MIAYQLQKIEKLLPFPNSHNVAKNMSVAPGTSSAYAAPVQMPFKPMGFIIWGATDETSILDLKVGNAGEGMVAWEPIPARFFETGKSFEEIEQLAEAGELALSLPQRQVLKMSTAEPGVNISVVLSGPFARFCMWGYSANMYEAPQVAEIVQLQDGTHEGRIVTSTLDGDNITAVVKTPGAVECAMLMNALKGRGRY